jgi:hypothetical protein
MPFLFSYGTLQKEQVQMETFGRILQGEKDYLPVIRGIIQSFSFQALKKAGSMECYTNLPMKKLLRQMSMK